MVQFGAFFGVVVKFDPSEGVVAGDPSARW